MDGIIRERLDEGQFDECDISMRDLRIAADSFVQSLSAVYHPRVEYPEPTRRELESRRTFETIEDAEDALPARSGRPRDERPRPTPSGPPRSVIVEDDDPVLSEDDT